MTTAKPTFPPLSIARAERRDGRGGTAPALFYLQMTTCHVRQRHNSHCERVECGRMYDSVNSIIWGE